MALVTTFSVSSPKSDIVADKKKNTIAQEYTLLNSVQINLLQAIKIVKKTIPGAKIVELELEKEEDILVWEVEYFSEKNKYEMYINAKTGKIEKIKKIKSK